MREKKCVIIANGEPLLAELFDAFIRQDVLVICADGALSVCHHRNIHPDVIIGDMDSADPILLKKYSKISLIRKLNRQSDTDLEKAFKYAISKKVTDVIVLCADGFRFDHKLSNVSAMVKFADRMNITMITNYSAGYFYPADITFRTVKNETISIFGFSEKLKISAKGLAYPINKRSLMIGISESISNRARGPSVQLTISGGIALVIRDISSALKLLNRD